jgi:hypothetical protein
VVTDVNLKLTLAGTGPGGGWNGDLYILLTHAGRASYLVNRPGRDSSGLWGYGDNGFSELVFDDEAPGDAHLYQDTLGVPADPASPVTGTVQPDGRGKDPMLVLDTDPRTFLLDVFDNRPADGPWRLLLFDLSPGGTFSLVDWELQLTYSQFIAIPETGRGRRPCRGGGGRPGSLALARTPSGDRIGSRLTRRPRPTGGGCGSVGTEECGATRGGGLVTRRVTLETAIGFATETRRAPSLRDLGRAFAG